jgi:hypothetical protein
MQIDPRPHLSLDSTRKIDAILNFGTMQPMSEPVIEIDPVIELDKDAEVLPDEPLDLAEISTLLLLGAIAGFALFVLFNAELI